VARARRRPADDGRGLEAVGGTVAALARAQLRLVTRTRGGAALDAGRPEPVRRAAGARPAAHLGGVAVTGGRAAHRSRVARQMETSGRAVAHVAGAGVAVVGADRPRRVGHAAGAGALLAGVVCRARVGIVAGSPVERVASAAKAGGAPVARRAGVVVLTDGAFLGCGIADADQLVALVAPEARAHVVRRARVAVVARCPLGLGVAAAGGGEAPIAARAGVFVVADRAFLGSGIADTEALRAHVVRRARVAVVALCPVGLGVAAADAGDADVVRRAGIEIVAGGVRRGGGIAGSVGVLGGVGRCARVAVVARRAGEQVGHAGPILAHAVLGTRVQLVAQSAVPRTRVPDASSRDAGVVRRARVAV